MSSVLTRQYTNIAALVLLVYDQIITWDKELNRVWRSSDWALKIMFFLGRYWALAFQIINLVVAHPHFFKRREISCHLWFNFQNYAVAVLLVNLQLILMLRVHALYERSTRIAAFLICWVVFYTAMMVFLGRKLVHALKLDSNCMMVQAPSPKITVSFSALCMLDQCILWGLTAYKYQDTMRRGWPTNPILQLVMRDASWTFLAICCLFIAVLPYSLIMKHLAHTAHGLFCSLVSILTCRTILNLRGLSVSDGPLSIDVTTVDLELTNPVHSE